ncbi:MAG TPA: hypothetical protein VF554_15865 [Thermoanaerobaculia bacterium]
MSLGRRGRILLAVFALALGLLLALSSDTLSFTVRTEGSRVVIDTGAHRFEGDLSEADVVDVRYYPQTRFSTGQFLFPDRGFVRNGIAILGQLGRRPKLEPPAFLQKAGTEVRYVLFNPFRGAFTVHRGQPELRLDVNVPDDALESWQGGRKTQQVTLHPPWLKLTVAPLAAAAFLAGFFVALALLAGGGRSASGGTGANGAPAPARRTGLVVPLLVFAFGAALSAGIFQGVFHAMPGFGDEMNYLMEGRILASLHLSVPEPPHPEFFGVGWMDMFGADHRVWGFHPPGNSALLALGWLVGTPWITVPLVFGAILAVQYLLAKDVLGSSGWALVNVLVVATSHYVLSLSSSYMAHAPSFLFLSLYVLLLLRFVRTGKGRLLVFAAAAAGFAFCIRPMSAVLASLVPIPALLVAARGKATRRVWIAAFATGLGISLLVFLYTLGITGRFTLPYAIKGPEVGQTVWVRLTKSWDTHFTNFFRNTNEFQHRVHSFGILGNMVFFFLPLVAWPWKRLSRALALAFATFFVFVVAHSVLHWYGWKWEPRMLFDVSFLFFLGTTAGLQAFVELLPPGRWVRRLALVAAALALAFVVGRDLPWRLKEEYHDYNLAPTGVRDAIAKRGLHGAVIFFGSEKAYSCYTPANTPRFDGDIVYAKSQGELLDYLLLARFPTRRAFYTPDGNTLVVKPNFYRKDVDTLRHDLEALDGARATVVMPWLSVAPSPVNDRLPANVEDPGRFLARLARGGTATHEPTLVAFLEGSTELARLADLSFETSTPSGLSAYEGPVVFRRIGGRRPGAANRFPGIWSTCREGTRWEGAVLSEQLVSTLDIGVCPGEDRSLTFETEFELKAPRRCLFTTESDDGSGVFVDGKLVVDNSLEGTHGPESRAGAVELTPGVHRLLVKYFNGPGGGRLTATLDDAAGRPVPITVAGFLDEFYFFVTRFGAPAGGTRGK